MDSLSDYVQWMGDFPISATGFRDADALILCSLSYIEFSPLFSDNASSCYLRDCLSHSLPFKVMVVGETAGYSELLKLAAASKRFGDLRLSNYVNIRRRKPPLQFSAVCFHDDQVPFSFIAYRGTDNSIAGWKEDFMISFTRTEAQHLALKYAKETMTADRDWYLCGHSKGSNLALYAACLIPDELLKTIRRLYLFDGPGFCPEVMDQSLIKRINDRTTQLQPAFCVVGKLFEPKIRDTRIVHSSASALLQHAIITWGVDHGKPAHAVEHDPTCKIINEATDEWIADIPQKDRKIFVDDLFGSLSANSHETLDDIQAGGLASLEAIYKRFIEINEVTKRALSTLPKYAVKASLEDFRNKLIAELEKRIK